VVEHALGADSKGAERDPGGAVAYLGRRATVRATGAAVAFATSLYAVTRSVRASGARKRAAWMALAAITAGQGMGLLWTLPPLESATGTEDRSAA
jgi:hypothetical protein